MEPDNLKNGMAQQGKYEEPDKGKREFFTDPADALRFRASAATREFYSKDTSGFNSFLTK